MSSIARSTNVTIKRKMSCKVCLDAGKPESEYSTHYVKDRQGNVVCPTLKSVRCRLCNKAGHTVKYCKTLKTTTSDEDQKKKQPKVAFVADIKPANMFARLCCDSDEEEEGEIRDEDEFPKLNDSKVTTAVTSDKMTYAQTIAIAAPPLPIPVLVRSSNAAPNKEQPKRWADYSSDEEDDEEDIYEQDVFGREF
jgi:hypothetical protein